MWPIRSTNRPSLVWLPAFVIIAGALLIVGILSNRGSVTIAPKVEIVFTVPSVHIKEYRGMLYRFAEEHALDVDIVQQRPDPAYFLAQLGRDPIRLISVHSGEPGIGGRDQYNVFVYDREDVRNDLAPELIAEQFIRRLLTDVAGVDVEKNATSDR